MSGGWLCFASALLNGVFSKRVDSGSWSHDDWSLAFEPDGAEARSYDAWYIAVQNGFLLHLTDRKFTGDSEDFARAE